MLELLQIERLDQVMIEARCMRAVAVDVHSISCLLRRLLLRDVALHPGSRKAKHLRQALIRRRIASAERINCAGLPEYVFLQRMGLVVSRFQ